MHMFVVHDLRFYAIGETPLFENCSGENFATRNSVKKPYLFQMMPTRTDGMGANGIRT